MQVNSRRLFIQNTTATALVALFTNSFTNLFATSYNKDVNIWQELVEYARWCPTVHNLQPHRLKIISKTEAHLYYDPTKLLAIEDPQAIFTTIAFGVFIECLSIAASPYKLKIEITKLHEPIVTNAKEITLFATLKLVESNGIEIMDRSLILQRKTSRLHYSGKALSSESVFKIKNETEKLKHEFFSTNDEKIVNEIISLNQNTLFEDLESKAVREELKLLFRYTKEDAEKKKDGLWSECMCFSGSLLKSVFTHPKKWQKGLLKKLLEKNYKASFKGTSTICWLGGNFKNEKDWLHAGKVLARNWLLITKENAFIHPFGSLITNENAYKKINEICAQPNNEKKIWMIFRAGYSKEPARSFRLPVTEIIIK